MTPAKVKKVVVGLSGGVDSSVAAALLLDAGYDVIGVFIKAWQPDFLPCTWKEDRQSAMQVAAHLRIPFHTVDLSAEYKSRVFDHMLEAYSKGETPNPDVACNEFIKFGFFVDFAKTLDAEYVATGHYAQLAHVGQEIAIRMAADREKDQSYFLAHIPKSALPSVLFPIGHLVKSEVRAIARQKGLPTHNRKDSQGLCFVGDLDMKDFLKQTLPHTPGSVLDRAGTVIGTHDGAALYTVGERHGFRVRNNNAEHEALYVISKDMIRNTITVAPASRIQGSMQITLRSVYWYVADTDITALTARYRYRQPLQSVSVQKVGDTVQLSMLQAGDRPSVGQIAAIYSDDVLVASGYIAGITPSG